MAITRDDKPQENQTTNTEKLKPFSELAHSQPEFDSVGMMWSVKEHRISKTVLTPNELTITNATLASSGSGVYIGNRMVITAAHCVPKFVKNGQFINHLTQNYYFFTKNKNGGNLCGVRIIRAERHPEFKEHKAGLATRGIEMSADIAVLLLDGEPNHVDTAKMDFTPFSIKNNCIAVGFPHLFIPRQHDDKRVLSDSPTGFNKKKIAVKIPSSYINQDTLESAIGRDAKILENEIQLVQRACNALEDGITGGMSGGGWFSSDNKLIGVSSAQDLPSSDYKNTSTSSYSHIIGDRSWAAPLFKNKIWLEKTILTFQNELPEFKALSSTWHEKRKEHELKRESKVDSQAKAIVNKAYPKPATVAAATLAGLGVLYGIYKFFQGGSGNQSSQAARQTGPDLCKTSCKF